LSEYHLFVGWEIEAESIKLNTEENQGSKRELGLIMLAFIHFLMRRSYLGDEELGSMEPIFLDLIILGCLKAIYMEGLGGHEHVLPLSIMNL